MKLSFKGDLPKRALVAVALLALVASVVVGREKPSAPALERAARTEASIELPDIDLEKLERREGQASRADPFASRSFAPKQAEAAHGAAKPSAPPLPFTYLGKAIESGKLSVFLARGEDSFSVEAGRKIDADYRVEKVSETAVTFLYVPLKTRQTLDIPAVNQ